MTMRSREVARVREREDGMMFTDRHLRGGAAWLDDRGLDGGARGWENPPP